MGELLSPLVLQNAFEKAHQLFFTTAFSTLTRFSDPDLGVPVNARAGFILNRPGAVVFVRTIAIVVEIALDLVVFLTSPLVYYSVRRPSNLLHDLASIADIMCIIRQGDAATNGLQGAGTLEGRNPSLISSYSFKLECAGRDFVGLSSNLLDRENQQIHTTASTTLKGQGDVLSIIEPRELSPGTGACFIFF